MDCFSVIEPGNDFVGLGQNIPLRRGLFPALENIQTLGLKEFNNRIADVDEVDAAGFGFGIHSFVARHPPRFGLRHGFCR